MKQEEGDNQNASEPNAERCMVSLAMCEKIYPLTKEQLDFEANDLGERVLEKLIRKKRERVAQEQAEVEQHGQKDIANASAFEAGKKMSCSALFCAKDF